MMSLGLGQRAMSKTAMPQQLSGDMCLTCTYRKSGWDTMRQRGDLSPCGQSPMDFESITLATRSHCHARCMHAPPGQCVAREKAATHVARLLMV